MQAVPRAKHEIAIQTMAPNRSYSAASAAFGRLSGLMQFILHVGAG